MAASYPEKTIEILMSYGKTLLNGVQISRLLNIIAELENFSIDFTPQFNLFRAEVFRLGGEPDNAKIILDRMEQPGDDRLNVRYLCEAACLKAYRGKYKEAAEDAARIYQLIDAVIDPYQRYEILTTIGYIYFQNGELEKSLPIYEQAGMTALLHNLDEKAETIEVMSSLIKTLLNIKLGNTDYMTLILDTDRFKNNPAIKRTIDLFVSTIFYKNGDYKNAIAKLEPHYKADMINDADFEVNAVVLLAKYRAHNSRVDRLEILLEKGIKKCLELGRPRKAIDLLCNFSFRFLNRGFREKAIECLDRAKKMSCSKQYRVSKLISANHLARIYLQDNLDKTWEIISEHGQGLLDFQDNKLILLANMIICEYYYRKGNREKFEEFLIILQKTEEINEKAFKVALDYFLLFFGCTKRKGSKLLKKNILSDTFKLETTGKIFMLQEMNRLENLSPGKERYKMSTCNGTALIGADAYKLIKEDKKSYDLWLDSNESLFFEKEKGLLKIENKKNTFDLLALLISRPGYRFSASEIYEKIWGGEFDYELNWHSLRTLIYRLRKIIEPDTGDHKYIITDLTAFEGESAWYFNYETNFCFIRRESEQPCSKHP